MPEPLENQYYLAGHIARSHGVDGTVLIVPVIEAAQPELFDSVELVRLQNERSDLIPARIDTVKIQEKDDRISFFVKFEHINNRNEAEEITRMPVFIDKGQVENSLAADDPLISFKVLNEMGDYIGIVDSVIHNPAHPILEISTDTLKILVPFVDEYIDEVNEDEQTICCKNLDQLDVL